MLLDLGAAVPSDELPPLPPPPPPPPLAPSPPLWPPTLATVDRMVRRAVSSIRQLAGRAEPQQEEQEPEQPDDPFNAMFKLAFPRLSLPLLRRLAHGRLIRPSWLVGEAACRGMPFVRLLLETNPDETIQCIRTWCQRIAHGNTEFQKKGILGHDQTFDAADDEACALILYLGCGDERDVAALRARGWDMSDPALLDTSRLVPYWQRLKVFIDPGQLLRTRVPLMQRLLIAMGAGIEDVGLSTDNTPLLNCAKNTGKLVTREALEVFIQAGANLHHRNRHGNTVLHVLENPARGVCTYLVQAGANPNALNKHGHAPLHHALVSRKLTFSATCPLLEELLAAEAGVNALNGEGQTALHMLNYFPTIPYLPGQVPKLYTLEDRCIVTKMLLAAGADPNLPDQYGWSAFHYLFARYTTGWYADDVQRQHDWQYILLFLASGKVNVDQPIRQYYTLPPHRRLFPLSKLFTPGPDALPPAPAPAGRYPSLNITNVPASLEQYEDGIQWNKRYGHCSCDRQDFLLHVTRSLIKPNIFEEELDDDIDDN